MRGEQERKGREITMGSSDLYVEEDERPSDDRFHEMLTRSDLENDLRDWYRDFDRPGHKH